MTLVLKDAYIPSSPSTAFPRRFVLSVLAFLFLIAALASIAFGFYRAQAHHGFARFVARILPLPVARVDGEWVWYREVSERANALEAIAGLSSDEAVLRAIDLAERAAIVRMIAKELGVTVTNDEVTAFTTDDAELIALRDAAGLTESDYRRYGVTPYVLAQKTEAAVRASLVYQAPARARLERIVLKYDEGIPFADLALAYSEGDTAYLGGDLGYVDPAMLPSPLGTAAASLATDSMSDILETEDAFWLLYAVDRLAAEDEATAMVRVRAIAIKKDLLGDVVDHALLTTKVTLWLR